MTNLHWFEKLKFVRKKLGFTLRQVEQMSGVSNPLLSQLENGKIKNPSVFTIIKILRVYDLDFYDVFKIKDS